MNEERPPRHAEVSRGQFRLPYQKHDFASHCFDTLKCHVLYDNRFDTREDNPSQPLTKMVLKNLYADVVGIDNFPPPAHVAWTSNDGASHETHIDIGALFNDQYVRYGPELNVSDVDLSHDYSYSYPGIILVVNDRNISVYMRTMITLRHPRTPGNPYSDFWNDLVLVFSRNY